MGALDSIFTFLTTPEGSLVYHIVLVFAIITTLQSAYFHARASGFPQARRAVFGLAILISAQIALFLFSALAEQRLINLPAFLPPIDRALTLFSLLWLIWLWVFPEPSRSADVTISLISLLVAAAFTATLLYYSQNPVSFNLTFYDFLWQVTSIGTAIIGLILILIRRPNGWSNGVAVLFLALTGHVVYLLFGRNAEGEFPGAVRLAYLAIAPILMTLPQRFPAPPAGPTSVNRQTSPVDERRRYSTDPKTFHALLSLAAESSTDKLSQAITRAIAQTMLADLCFLIYLTDNNNQMQIASGYDLIREENLDGGSLNKTVIPMLTNALQRGRPLRLPSSSTSADIKGLSDLLGLNSPGHLMSVPIVTPEKDPLGGVLLLSPYSNRLWSAEDQAFLANIAMSLVPIIQRGQKMSSLEIKGEQTRQALEASQMRITDLERRNEDLLKQMDAVRADAQEGLSQAENLVALTKMQEETQKAIEKLKAENEELRSAKPVAVNNSTSVTSVASKQVEDELRRTLEEVARLQNQLAETNMRVIEAEKGSVATRSTEQAEVVASISQELRQPMSSIVGYTDLLLGESVGILGALQRKFVERIKASTERIGTLIDDLIQVTTLETGLNDLKPESVDLNLIIDNAMSYTSSQVREKNISIHLDLPKNMAPIQADREALQQIVIHLLQNAGAASPIEGSVHLKVKKQAESAQEYVLIQVTDSGGGIPAEDLPRVFTRLYRADNVLIQGVGDTGVGLSIAKTLTEAQKGRIWVETNMGSGSTFSVLLPIAKNGPSRVAEK
jgi:signal transduction histidine kinase